MIMGRTEFPKPRLRENRENGKENSVVRVSGVPPDLSVCFLHAKQPNHDCAREGHERLP
jgi:hypothetical protein